SNPIFEANGSRRSARALRFLSSNEGLVSGRNVEISAADMGRNALTATTGPHFFRTYSAFSTADLGAAHGMIFMVANICPFVTRENGDNVASVIDSWRVFSSATASAEIVTT